MERLYHYLWKNNMFGRQLKVGPDEIVEVIDPGIHNEDAGPDFYNSKIKIGDTEWIGNVEIHTRASDWHRHGHDNDPAYDNVILHVVGVEDKKIARRDGTIIPQVCVTFPQEFYSTLSVLSEDIDAIRCGPYISELSDIVKTDWLESLSIERLQSKGSKIYDIYQSTGQDWEQTCFIIFARALGFGLNGDPFELLGRSVPLKILYHHSDDPMQIEAVLFGQAAMLDSSLHIFDEYYQGLCREYFFLARKYNLRPMRPGLWKYSKTRPQNFPHRRIAYLACACRNGFSLFTDIVAGASDVAHLRELFKFRLDGYWHSHFSFDRDARLTSDTLSENSINLLLINAAIPLTYVNACLKGDVEKAEKAVNLLLELPAESNKITRQWQRYGIEAADAKRTQALIHLTKEYCEKRKCLFCRFGSAVLKKKSDFDN